MHIVHVNTAKSWRGGEAQALGLMRGLRDAGDQVTLVAQPASPLLERAEAAAIPCVALPMGSAIDRSCGRAIEALLREHKAELVHAHTSHAHSHARRAILRMGASAPPLVVTRHVAYSIFRHGILRLNRRKYVHGVARILCVSEAVREQLRRDGIPDPLLEVVHNGAAPEAFEDVAASPEAEAAFDRARGRLLSVGALTPEKGHMQIVDALPAVAALHPKVRYVVAGTGDEADALRARADALGVSDHLHLAGFVEDPRTWMAAADVVIVPSRSEGFSLGLLEAMCQGAAILTTATSGMADLVRPEQEAAIMPLDDPERTAARIIELLDQPTLRDQLGSQARRRAETQFPLARTVERTRAIYLSLLS